MSTNFFEILLGIKQYAFFEAKQCVFTFKYAFRPYLSIVVENCSHIFYLNQYPKNCTQHRNYTSRLVISLSQSLTIGHQATICVDLVIVTFYIVFSYKGTVHFSLENQAADAHHNDSPTRGQSVLIYFLLLFIFNCLFSVSRKSNSFQNIYIYIYKCRWYVD